MFLYILEQLYVALFETFQRQEIESSTLRMASTFVGFYSLMFSLTCISKECLEIVYFETYLKIDNMF